jgi:WD40 repeat protein
MIAALKKIRYIILLLSLPLLSACSTTAHQDFLKNFARSQETDGSRPRVVVSLAYNEKEKYLLVGHESGSVEIWDAKEARSVREIKAHDGRANLLAFSSDGNAFFSNSYFENNTKLWNAQTGELLSTIPDTRGPVSITSDRRFYIIANSEELRIFDYGNKTLLPEKFRFSYDVVTTIAYDTSTDQVAIGTASGTIQILRFSMIKGKPTLESVSNANPYSMGNWVVGLQFSRNGRGLYSVARFGSIDEWSTQPLEIKRSLPTALRNIYSTAFMPNKGLLALSGTGEHIYPFPGAGIVEIFTLSSGIKSTFDMNSNYPGPVELLSPSIVLSARHRSIEVYSLPQE